MIRPLIKKTSRWAIDSRLFNEAARVLERQDRQSNRLRVLTYHRVLPVAEQPSRYPGLISTSPEGLAQQADFLVENYDVVSMERVLAAVSGGPALPPRAVLLTFDDAYTDFARYAWPVLRARQLPVTVFVPTAFPDEPSQCFWWDRIHHACLHTTATVLCGTPLGRLSLETRDERVIAAGRLNTLFKSLLHSDALRLIEQVQQELAPPPLTNEVLGWDDLRRLSQQGVTLAAHTRSHPLLHRMPVESAVAEAVQSHEDLRREIGNTLPVLAYPGGGHTPQLADQLRSAFTLAFSTRRGINQMGTTDPLTLCRINVGRKTTTHTLRAQLLLWAGFFHRHCHAMTRV